MGQLEKYGLYVLCLLIFLILGVTVMGSGEVADAASRQGEMAKLAGPGRPEQLGGLQARPDANGPAGGSGVTTIVDILRPNPLPEKPEPKVEPGPHGELPEIGGDAPKVTDEPQPPAPVADAARPRHTIRPGDNFERIALEYYGRRSLGAKLRQLNAKVDPRRMKPGSEIDLFTKVEVDALLGKQAPVNRTGDEVPAGVRLYTIQQNDTFEGIALRELGSRRRVDEIRALNPDVEPRSMKIGGSLKLPAK